MLSGHIRGCASYALLFASVLFCMGCQEEVTAVLGTDRAYSVYGFFNARADTQAVRIYAIEQRLDLIRPEPLDAGVASMDRTNGLQHAWRDSVTQFIGGRYGHVFWSPFRAGYGHSYILEITRSDGVTSRAEVTVPPLSEPVLLDPTIAEGYVILPVHWSEAPRVNDIRVWYYTNKGNYLIEYPLDQEQEGGGTVVAVTMSTDAREIFARVVRGGERAADVRLKAIELFVLVSNAEWMPPEGGYDPETLVEPGTFSNVENGYGFVGAGYEASFYYEPPDSTVLAAGFFIDAR